MKVARTKIADYVAENSLKGGSSKQISKQLAAYLLDEGRVSELDSILRDVQQDWADAGIIEVEAASAHPLSNAVIADIKAQVKTIYPSAKQIIINQIEDPAIVGGVKLSLPGQQLDLSIEAKLNKFKNLTNGGKA